MSCLDFPIAYFDSYVLTNEKFKNLQFSNLFVLIKKKIKTLDRS